MSNRPPSERQRRVAKALIDNITLDEPKTGGEMLEEVGFSDGIVKSPGRVLNSEGVQKALAEMGFTVEKADSTVLSIMNNDGERSEVRLKASDMVYKRLGGYAPEKSINIDVQVSTEGVEELKDLAKTMSQNIKQAYTNGDRSEDIKETS